MPIAHIANGESGLSVRNKLNLAIDGVNSEIVPPTVLTLNYTGTLPFEFPMVQAGPWWSHVRPGASGDNTLMIGSGVGIYNSLFFTDSRGLLTSIDFANLGAVLGNGGFNSGNAISITNCAALTSLKMAALECVGSGFTVTSMAALTVLDLSSLDHILFNCTIATMASLTSLSAPNLNFVGNNFSASAMASLTSINFNLLDTVVGTVTFSTMGSLVTLSLPALKYCGGNFLVTAMASLTTVSFPAMVSYEGVITATTGLGALANVTLGTVGTLKEAAGVIINLSGQALTAASVNAILALLVSLDGTNGTTLWGSGKTVNLSGGTSAAPSGQGIVDKATLTTRGATVTTN